jgi:TolB-like protein
VLPLVNLSKYDEAGDIFYRSLLVELLDVNIFNVVDPGQVDDVVLRKRIRYTDRLPLETMLELGRELDTRFLLLGSVNEYRMVTDRVNTIPLVSISLRIVECETGNIFWAATHTRRGDDSESVFGLGRIETLLQLVSVTSKEIVQTLEK